MRCRYALLSLCAVTGLTAAPASAQWSNQMFSKARGRAVSASVGDLAFFAGGEDPSLALNYGDVDIYDGAMDAWTPEQLSVARSRLAATSVGHLALFGGGGIDPVTAFTTVDVFDTQTMTWLPVQALSQARAHLAAASAGQKALFAGGNLGLVASDVVDVFDLQAMSWAVGQPLSVARQQLAAASVGGKALFAGGVDPLVGFYDTVDIYDVATDSWSQAQLKQARADLAAVTIGTRAYFIGGLFGMGPGSASDVIDVYDSQTGTWTDIKMPSPRFGMQAAAVGNTLIIAGGGDNFGVVLDTIDKLNVGTGQWDSTRQLSLARYNMGAASVAGKALFAGGLWEALPNSQATDLVDVYEPVGSNYCAALPNSTGCAATISAVGSASLAANDLVLGSSCMPDGVYIFFHASNQLQVPFGNGILCASGNVFRILPAAIASGGMVQRTLDLPSVGITSPGLRNFQCWFRDVPAGGAAFNTSDALAITFVP